jgi:hypothetical protein
MLNRPAFSINIMPSQFNDLEMESNVFVVRLLRLQNSFLIRLFPDGTGI